PPGAAGGRYGPAAVRRRRRAADPSPAAASGAPESHRGRAWGSPPGPLPLGTGATWRATKTPARPRVRNEKGRFPRGKPPFKYLRAIRCAQPARNRSVEVRLYIAIGLDGLFAVSCPERGVADRVGADAERLSPTGGVPGQVFPID